MRRDFAVRDPTADLGETFNLARAPNLQGQDTGPIGAVEGGCRGEGIQVKSYASGLADGRGL